MHQKLFQRDRCAILSYSIVNFRQNGAQNCKYIFHQHDSIYSDTSRALSRCHTNSTICLSIHLYSTDLASYAITTVHATNKPILHCTIQRSICCTEDTRNFLNPIPSSVIQLVIGKCSIRRSMKPTASSAPNRKAGPATVNHWPDQRV